MGTIVYIVYLPMLIHSFKNQPFMYIGQCTSLMDAIRDRIDHIRVSLIPHNLYINHISPSLPLYFNNPI